MFERFRFPVCIHANGQSTREGWIPQRESIYPLALASERALLCVYDEQHFSPGSPSLLSRSPLACISIITLAGIIRAAVSQSSRNAAAARPKYRRERSNRRRNVWIVPTETESLPRAFDD